MQRQRDTAQKSFNAQFRKLLQEKEVLTADLAASRLAEETQKKENEDCRGQMARHAHMHT